MKKSFLTLLLLPLVLTSCGNSGVGFEAFRAKVEEVPDSAEYPYYRVIGSLDFNNEFMEVDSTFDKEPGINTFVPFARYNNGFYCVDAGDSENEDEVVIYAMASHSYWLRAPLRINAANFYKEVDDDGVFKENNSCANYILSHIITSYMSQPGSINPSGNVAYYELLPDGGFAVGGNAVHTEFVIDNYPYYPDYNKRQEELGEWDSSNPLPCYKNTVNAKVNVRFEYNKDGWLVSESLSSVGYNYNDANISQVALKAIYKYKFA